MVIDEQRLDIRFQARRSSLQHRKPTSPVAHRAPCLISTGFCFRR